MTPRRCASAGKVRFRSEAYAGEVVVYLQEKRNEPLRRSRRLSVYGCGACGDFHVGHLTIAAFKARRRAEAASV